MPEHCKRRPSQYMNNIVEQDHRFMKRKINPGLGFGSYPTAWRTIQGYETMHMVRKGQIEGAETGNIQGQNEFIARTVWPSCVTPYRPFRIILPA